MAKDRKHRKGGRTTPKGTRPNHLRALPDERSPLDDLIDSAGRELLDDGDPIAAETWASGMLHLFDAAVADARREGIEAPPLADALLEHCGHRGDAAALVVSAALAAVAPPPLDAAAAAVVAALSARAPKVPDWIDRVGAVVATRAWAVSDAYGDQDSVIVAFRQDGEVSDHGLSVLVDHNVSGQAKDAMLVEDVDELIGLWRAETAREPGLRVEEVAVADALGRIYAAMATADLFDGDADLRTEDFANQRALIAARLRRAGCTDTTPSDARDDDSDRAALVAAFLASGDGEQVRRAHAGVDVEILASYLVDLRADYEGAPLRWSPSVVDSVLLDLAPRKLLIDADAAAALPDVVRAFVRFAGARTGLAERFVGDTIAAVDDLEADYLALMGDPSAAGPAKSVLAALAARGTDIGDLDALQDALESVVGMQMPEPAVKKRRSTAAAPVEIVEAAAATTVLARLGILTEFYGAGRKLTQKGHPTLADARVLIERLGTADRMDETIGDRTFKTRSADDLPELSFMLRWAITAGALRKQHGKLLATAAWGKLHGDPLRRWMKAAEALPTLGPLAAFYAGGRLGDHDLVDELVPGVFGMLAAGPEYEDVLDFVCEMIDARYQWPAGTWLAEPEARRRRFGWDLDRLTEILGWAGIAERVDAVARADEVLTERIRLVGGTIRLTPLGRWWLSG